MPRDSIVKARQDRNAALIDAMILAASADGQVDPGELRVLLARVQERPEFEGTQPEELIDLVEASVARLSKARRLEEVLESLRARLPDHRNRLLAFGLATAVALTDNRAAKEELGLLKTLQAALGVSEQEVTRIFEMVEKGRSLAEALGEPVEQLYAETMVLVAAADGVVHEAELLTMIENMAADPAFKGTSILGAEKHLNAAVKDLAHDGVAKRLTALAQGLTGHHQRLKAFELATRVAWADGKPSDKELKVLELLQATFGLADDETARISGGR